jgi:hypothetical protein
MMHFNKFTVATALSIGAALLAANGQHYAWPLFLTAAIALAWRFRL